MPTIKVDLTSKGLNKLEKDLKKYMRDFKQTKVRQFMMALSEKCADLVRENIISYQAVDTWDLYESIKVLMNKNYYKGQLRFFVVADSKHACFVEFGTGSVGANSPYPFELPEGVKWNYASGKHIFQTKDGRYGWIYYKDGEFWFTEGMEARPFMHDASMRVETYVESIAKEIFKS